MKTNKFWGIMVMLYLVLGTAVTFSSCSNDDDDEVGGISIKGMWKEQWGESTLAIEFIDNNSMYDYGNISKSKDTYVGTPKPISGHPGWYYTNKRLYTYYVVKNKIFVSDGTIYTVTNGKIYEEGAPTEYYYVRW